MQTETNNYASTRNTDTEISNNLGPVAREHLQKLSTFGMYTNHYDAKRAIARLEKSGFARENISVLAPQAYGGRDFVYQQQTNIKEGALIGAIIGFFVLGFIGFLLGLGALTPLETMIEPNLAASIPSWAFSAAIGSVIGIIYGAASGALVGIGAPKTAAKRYGFYLKEGAIMLCVDLKNEDQRIRANDILEKTRAQDISDLQESEIWKTIVPEKKKLSQS